MTAASAGEMDDAATVKLPIKVEAVTSESDVRTNRTTGGGSCESSLNAGEGAEAKEPAVKPESGKPEASQEGALREPDRTRYKSDETLSDGTRVIVKADGAKITVQAGGKFAIEYPPDHPREIERKKAELAHLAKEAEKNPLRLSGSGMNPPTFRTCRWLRDR